MGFHPLESLENTINTMGTLLGVHPIIPMTNGNQLWIGKIMTHFNGMKWCYTPWNWSFARKNVGFQVRNLLIQRGLFSGAMFVSLREGIADGFSNPVVARVGFFRSVSPLFCTGFFIDPRCFVGLLNHQSVTFRFWNCAFLFGQATLD